MHPAGTGRPNRFQWPGLRFWVAICGGAGTGIASWFVLNLMAYLGFYGFGWFAAFRSLLAFAVVGFAAGTIVGWARQYHPRLAARLVTWKAWSSVGLGTVGSFWAVIFLIGLGRLGLYRLAFAEAQVPELLGGFYTSLEVVSVILPMGFGIGFLVGWARTTKSVVLRGFAAYYVDFFRSMPPIGLIFFASLVGGIALKGTAVNPYAVRNITLWLGVFALAFHTAAYQAEIVRAGILSVPAGQTEAADAVGISRLRTVFVVTLPQAFRISLPALGNEFSSSIKDTSLLSVIGWMELSGVAYNLVPTALIDYHYLYGSLVIWMQVALLYFVLTYVVTRTVRGVEDLFKVPGLEAARL